MIRLGAIVYIEDMPGEWVVHDFDPMQETFVVKRSSDGAVGQVHISDLTTESRERVRAANER